MTAVRSEVLNFSEISCDRLAELNDTEVDLLPFGVIGLSSGNLVEVYNRTESQLAGLPRDAVMGMDFFTTTAQCMNNFMVAQRFQDEAELDAEFDYVLTFRMRPTRVRLRLLQSGANRRYILVQR
jgi:photoactive yellow protein